jgi:3-hydroxybutyryl-CoA dehydrogenase
MKILVIGTSLHFGECQEKFGQVHTCSWIENHSDATRHFQDHNLVLDFMIDEAPQAFAIYAGKPVTVMLNTCRVSLAALAHTVGNIMACTIFGFNGMPTLLNREVLEVSVWQQQDLPRLQALCHELNTKFLVVDDRVGLVTPRVVSMIINEAYYTVQEGTATRHDIDMAMKLGTNYPFGPFEWCQRIGIKYVYELLEAVYADTRDERYKICPLLKKEYLNAGKVIL